MNRHFDFECNMKEIQNWKKVHSWWICLQIEYYTTTTRPEVVIYKRKLERKKKETTLSTKTKKIRGKKEKKNHANDQEKNRKTKFRPRY